VAGPPTATIAIVDDDDNLREMLATALEFAGYATVSAANCQDGMTVITERDPDLVVLDLNLPDGDGLDLCRRLRASGVQTPVIFLTARDQPADVIAGFADGGDDYVTKPFRLAELSVRISAVLRRAVPLAASSVTSGGAGPVLRCGNVALDVAARRATYDGRAIDLTPREIDVLRYFIAHAGTVVSRADVVRGAWSTEHVGDDSLVETYVSRLRTKFDDDVVIRTVRGRGYVMDGDDPGIDGGGAER
jgi:two-component system OmpR family response regulator